MLCSTSTGKSSSNWLDRLRSIKGFPTDNDLDLETFLTRQKAEACNSSDAKLAKAEKCNSSDIPLSNENCSQAREIVDQKPPTEIPTENGEKDWKGVLSNVLNELFYMGEPREISEINRKKVPRKQGNPKIFSSSNPPKVSDVALSVPVSDDSSRTETKGKGEEKIITEQEDAVDVAPVDCDEEEEFPPDLAGFSRTEVTVIDTSCPSWKFEKMLYRRKNVWKARDKKGKQVNIGRKKRKLVPVEENGGNEKKLKASAGQCSASKEANGEEIYLPLQHQHCSASKEANGEEINLPLQQGNNQGNTMDEPCKQFPPKKRKSKTGGSSGVVKNIHTGKKSNNAGPKHPMK